MDDKKKKKYIIPEAEVVDFENHDIITLSGQDELLGWADPDGETWGA